MGCLGAPEAWGPWARAQRVHWIRRPWLINFIDLHLQQISAIGLILLANINITGLQQLRRQLIVMIR